MRNVACLFSATDIYFFFFFYGLKGLLGHRREAPGLHQEVLMSTAMEMQGRRLSAKS